MYTIYNPMNFTEGMRRLSLVIGVLGALCGLWTSYLIGSDLIGRITERRNFQALASSKFVVKEIAYMKSIPAPHKGEFIPSTPPDNTGVPPGFRIDSPWYYYEAQAALSGASEGWKMNRDGIKTLTFLSDGTLYTIEKQDGVKLYDRTSPSIAEYLFVLPWPLIGFALPWGILTLVSWVISGFIKT